MCVQDYNHKNTTEKVLADSRRFKGIKVSEYQQPEGVSLPDTVDWRTGGAVTMVKDQVGH